MAILELDREAFERQVLGSELPVGVGAKPATALERDLGLTGHGEQAEPAGGRTGRPRLRGSIRARWNGG